MKATSLVAPSDVAELAGVSRPVVSNWRKRHANFPRQIAGTDAKPLFDRGEVLGWLLDRGIKVDNANPGIDLWAALNALRDELPADRAVDLVLVCATAKRARPAEFTKLASNPSADAVIKVWDLVPELPNAEHLRPPISFWSGLTPAAGIVLSAIAKIDDDELAQSVDLVLGRLARSQVKAGAESGFIGSRTSELLASLVPANATSVYDPAMGIANVLLQVAALGVHLRLIGSEINESALRVAAQRSFLHHAGIEFTAGDVLRADPVTGLEADIVVAEPPFGCSWDPSAALSDPRYVFGVPPRSKSELAWIQHSIAHLAADGRAYVVTSMGPLFRSGSEAKIRANLLSAGCVEAIVGLPSKMLPQTSIELALWVLRPRSNPDDVLLIDARDVDDVESKVAPWLSDAPLERSADRPPQAKVPVTDLLAGDANLTPAKWLAAPPITSTEVASSFQRAAASLRRTARQVADLDLDFAYISGIAEPRMTTVRELLTAGVLELKVGRALPRDLSASDEARKVNAIDIKHRDLRPVDGLSSAEQLDLSREGDILVTTMSEVRAMVDETGGHLPSSGIDRLRILQGEIITPSYLALSLGGSWNGRLQTGTTGIQRAPIRDLEIPLIPLDDQVRVVTAQASVQHIRAAGAVLATMASQAEVSILDAVRYHVELIEPKTTDEQEPYTKGSK